jgi:hypothetical protein
LSNTLTATTRKEKKKKELGRHLNCCLEKEKDGGRREGGGGGEGDHECSLTRKAEHVQNREKKKAVKKQCTHLFSSFSFSVFLCKRRQSNALSLSVLFMLFFCCSPFFFPFSRFFLWLAVDADAAAADGFFFFFTAVQKKSSAVTDSTTHTHASPVMPYAATTKFGPPGLFASFFFIFLSWTARRDRPRRVRREK